MSTVVTFGETMARLSATRVEPLSLASSLSVGVGGAESNVATGVVRLGMGATWIGRVGTDEFGRRVVSTLGGEGIDVSRVVYDEAAPTGLMIKERRTAGLTRVVYYRNRSAGSRLATQDLPEDILRAASVLHCTGITPALSTTAKEATFHAIETARSADTTVSFDLNYRRALWSVEECRSVLLELTRRADIVLATHDEARMLGIDGADDEHVLAQLSALGPRTAVLKCGAEGVRAVVDGERLDMPAVPVDVIDPVGAGDAFAAGFLVGSINDRSPADRLRLGAQVAGFAVASEGDWEGLPTSLELESMDGGTGDILR